MATVHIQEVSKAYEKQVILDRINLSIEVGEFVAVVGPSGSGKSTLLRLVAGLDTVNSGKILINNQCVNQIPPALRDMAMVFQNYALYPHMTVYANMAYGLKMRKMKKTDIHERVMAVANLLQLTDFLTRKPAALSGGQRQRVAMGRAIVRKPAVFLFDEPLSNLDAKLRTQMRHEIKKLHQQLNTTSLYVTHDQTEAMTLADRIVVINQGRVEQIGTPKALYELPETAFVASFMGHYPTNFIQGNIKNACLETEVGINFPWTVGGNEEAVLIAVRPEHWMMNAESPFNIEVELEFIDDMGSDKLLHVVYKKNNSRFCLRLSGDKATPSQRIFISPNLSKASVFSKKSGHRIGSLHEES